MFLHLFIEHFITDIRPIFLCLSEHIFYSLFTYLPRDDLDDLIF